MLCSKIAVSVTYTFVASSSVFGKVRLWADIKHCAISKNSTVPGGSGAAEYSLQTLRSRALTPHR